jgi:hypothetical protein
MLGSLETWELQERLSICLSSNPDAPLGQVCYYLAKELVATS